MMIGFFAGVMVYVLYIGYRCGFRVDEGHVGVLTTFGAAEQKPGSSELVIFGSGVHFKKPWQEAVDVMVMEQNLTLSGESQGRMCMAEDGTILRLDSILRYFPERQSLATYLFELNSPIEHITGLFTCLLRNEIANFPIHEKSEAELRASRGFEDDRIAFSVIQRGRKVLNDRIEELARSEISQRYGVRFSAVDLVDIVPPDDLVDALNAVIQARAEAQANYFNAQGECEQRILSAEKSVAIAGAHAQALELEINKLSEYLTELERQQVLDAYIERRRAEVLLEARASFIREAD